MFKEDFIYNSFRVYGICLRLNNHTTQDGVHHASFASLSISMCYCYRPPFLKVLLMQLLLATTILFQHVNLLSS